MSIKIKNNNMGMHSPNSVNISICSNGSNGGNKVNTIYNIGNGNFNNNSGIRINEDHINIRNNDDELEIDTKTNNHNFVKKIIIKLFRRGE